MRGMWRERVTLSGKREKRAANGRGESGTWSEAVPNQDEERT